MTELQTLTNNDSEIYLKQGKLSKIFIDTNILNQDVNNVLNSISKECINKNISILDALIYYINNKIKYAIDKNFRIKYKFGRTAKEIWQSKLSTGCTDYALVFATLARQLNIPTTLLHTAQYEWFKEFKAGNKTKLHSGHTFCECFIDNKWVLVDPTCRQITTEYNVSKLELNYKVGNSSVFIPYKRDLDLKIKQTISQHNRRMDKYCEEMTF